MARLRSWFRTRPRTRSWLTPRRKPTGKQPSQQFGKGLPTWMPGEPNQPEPRLLPWQRNLGSRCRASNVRFQVELSNKAEDDIAAALRWFKEQRATAAGTRWLSHLMERIVTLAE